MKQPISFLLILPLVSACSSMYNLQNSVPYSPRRTLDPPAHRVAVASSYDVLKESYRDKKENQFLLLIDGALQSMKTQVERNSDVEVKIQRGRAVVPSKEDSCFSAIIAMNEADYLVLLDSFKVFFDQTEVVVTKTDDGKSREAFYDIVSFVNYRLVGKSGSSESFPTSVRKFHSSRNVVSGLLAAGPDIVANHSDAVEIVELNVKEFLRNFFPGKDERVRPVYTSKDFANLSAHLKSGDLSAAVKDCESQTTNADRKIAAMAYYNLAVLAEHMGAYEKVRGFLSDSQRMHATPLASQMEEDYL
ncbi:MAG TPA: hypothetical protein VFW11_09880 [Cyclobacteriaceae bacterium]|nr:hypothetical protein [Cyclobacteriaceae bacterium]